MDASTLCSGPTIKHLAKARKRSRESGGIEIVLEFGKHNGRYLSDVQSEDPEHYQWLLGEIRKAEKP